MAGVNSSDCKGIAVLESALDHLGLNEREYFGLRYVSSSGKAHWLEPHKSLKRHLRQCKDPSFYFCVKFCIADPCKLTDEVTRYQFFLQLKQDISHGRLPVPFETLSELCALAVQSELGDYDPGLYPPGYASEFHFSPDQNEVLERQIEYRHKTLIGTTIAEAEYLYLAKVKLLDLYGIDLHPIVSEDNFRYFLGLASTGLVMVKNDEKTYTYLWPRIRKFQHVGCSFFVHVSDGKTNDIQHYGFRLYSKEECKHLFKSAMAHHAFFCKRNGWRSATIQRPPSSIMSIPRKLLRWGSRNRAFPWAENSYEIRSDASISRSNADTCAKSRTITYSRRARPEPGTRQVIHEDDKVKIVVDANGDIIKMPSSSIEDEDRFTSVTEDPKMHSLWFNEEKNVARSRASPFVEGHATQFANRERSLLYASLQRRARSQMNSHISGSMTLGRGKRKRESPKQVRHEIGAQSAAVNSGYTGLAANTAPPVTAAPKTETIRRSRRRPRARALRRKTFDAAGIKSSLQLVQSAPSTEPKLKTQYARACSMEGLNYAQVSPVAVGTSQVSLQKSLTTTIQKSVVNKPVLPKLPPLPVGGFSALGKESLTPKTAPVFGNTTSHFPFPPTVSATSTTSFDYSQISWPKPVFKKEEVKAKTEDTYAPLKQIESAPPTQPVSFTFPKFSTPPTTLESAIPTFGKPAPIYAQPNKTKSSTRITLATNSPLVPVIRQQNIFSFSAAHTRAASLPIKPSPLVQSNNHQSNKPETIDEEQQLLQFSPNKPEAEVEMSEEVKTNNILDLETPAIEKPNGLNLPPPAASSPTSEPLITLYEPMTPTDTLPDPLPPKLLNKTRLPSLGSDSSHNTASDELPTDKVDAELFTNNATQVFGEKESKILPMFTDSNNYETPKYSLPKNTPKPLALSSFSTATLPHRGIASSNWRKNLATINFNTAIPGVPKLPDSQDVSPLSSSSSSHSVSAPPPICPVPNGFATMRRLSKKSDGTSARLPLYKTYLMEDSCGLTQLCTEL